MSGPGAKATDVYTSNGLNTNYGYACYYLGQSYIAPSNHGCVMFKYIPESDRGFCYVSAYDSNCDRMGYANTGANPDYVFTSKYQYY